MLVYLFYQLFMKKCENKFWLKLKQNHETTLAYCDADYSCHCCAAARLYTSPCRIVCIRLLGVGSSLELDTKEGAILASFFWGGRAGVGGVRTLLGAFLAYNLQGDTFACGYKSCTCRVQNVRTYKLWTKSVDLEAIEDTTWPWKWNVGLPKVALPERLSDYYSGPLHIKHPFNWHNIFICNITDNTITILYYNFIT